MYSRATPGVNAPNVAGVPSVSDSVAGTVPPTVPSTGRRRVVGAAAQQDRAAELRLQALGVQAA